MSESLKNVIHVTVYTTYVTTLFSTDISLVLIFDLVWKDLSYSKSNYFTKLNPFRPDPGRGEQINLNFHFTLLCGASKGSMKVLKAFIKPSEAPQTSVKIIAFVNFYFNTAF